MALNILPDDSKQANRVAASEELASLPLYASMGHNVMARALALAKVFLPAELHSSVDAILDASAMSGSEWCVSAKERQVA